MKVLHLARTDNRPGAPRAAFRLHRFLRNIGVDSQMLVGEKLSNDPWVHGPSSATEKIYHHLSPYIDNIPLLFHRPVNSEKLSPSWIGAPLSKKINAYQSDITHLHWVCAGFMSVEGIGRLRGPIVWRLADMWAFSGAEHYTRESERYIEGYKRNNRPKGENGFDLNRWVWKRKTRAWQDLKNLTIVTPSRWMADCALKSKLFNDRRIEVIPTGVDTELFRELDKSNARNILGIPDNKFVILFGGAQIADFRKGGRYLLDAIIASRDVLQKNNVVIVTFGPGASAISSEYGLQQIDLGSITDERLMPLVYSSADLFIAPSVYDNLPNTVLEAMSCKAAVLSCKTGGIPDVIKDGIEGLLVAPGEAGELGHAMCKLIENDELRLKISKNARLRIEKELTLDAVARQYNALYKDIKAYVK